MKLKTLECTTILNMSLTPICINVKLLGFFIPQQTMPTIDQ